MKTQIIFLSMLMVCLISCEKNQPEVITENKKSPKVANVYDYNNKLIAHYLYNEKEQLIKREFTDPSTGYSSDLIFHYENDLINKIDYVDHNFPQFSHEKHYYYKSDNTIDKVESHQRGEHISTFYLNYSGRGLVESVSSERSKPSLSFKYDLNENLIKHTYSFLDEWTGEQVTTECEFTYDNKNKVSFGLDYLVGINLLPKRGTINTWQKTLSKNNLLSNSCDNTSYSFEYNENGNPISITTKWGDLITETPMTIRIEYEEE